MSIDLSEWLAELSRLTANGDGITPGEMQLEMNRSERWVTKHIKLGVRAGLLERAGKKMVERADGVLTPVMSFRPVKKKKK